MACQKCEERRRKLRDAIMRGKMGEAAGHVVAGVREMVGVVDEEPATEESDSAAPDEAPARRGRRRR